jgi:hypothetical protein
MRRLFLLLLLALPAGCQNTVGPYQRAANPRPVDVPCTSPALLERNRRELLALPDPSPAVGPNTYTAPPNVYR